MDNQRSFDQIHLLPELEGLPIVEMLKTLEGFKDDVESFMKAPVWIGNYSSLLES